MLNIILLFSFDGLTIVMGITDIVRIYTLLVVIYNRHKKNIISHKYTTPNANGSLDNQS